MRAVRRIGLRRAVPVLSAGALVAALVPGSAATGSERGAQASDGTVQPGVVLVAGDGACTSNFVFTDAARTLYLGMAAHCAAADRPENFNGCTDPTLPVGTTVRIADTDVSATLAYSSWASMQRSGEADRNTCLYNDFALVRLPESARSAVNSSVPYFGGPVGIDTDGSLPGDLVYSYGNSPLRQGIAVLAPKRGVVLERGNSGWTHRIYFATPAIPGDSGSGVLDEFGRAFGVASSLILLPGTGSNGIVDLAMALDYARTHSGIRGLRLVDGTAAFIPG